MGLDMYLYRQANGTDVSQLLNAADSPDEEFSEASYQRWKDIHGAVQVAYWRKANAIHAWFVDNFQGGVDECQYSKPISREALAGLVRRCQRILNEGEDPATLLPTRVGFFFGGYDYEESYQYDLKETIVQLEPLLSERTDDVFIYHSSW